MYASTALYARTAAAASGGPSGAADNAPGASAKNGPGAPQTPLAAVAHRQHPIAAARRSAATPRLRGARFSDTHPCPRPAIAVFDTPPLSGTRAAPVPLSAAATTKERSPRMSQLLQISPSQQRVIVLFILSFAAMC
jgi:hypothetical protein